MLSKVNEAIAVRLTKVTGTMGCVYAFLVLAVAPLAVPSFTSLSQYISTTVLQLVLLPLIMVGQSIMGRDGEERARQDHETIAAILEDEMVDKGDLTAIMARLDKIEALLAPSRS